MVTADRERFCRRAVACYLRQTWPNRELVVVDDGRTDLGGALRDVPSAELRYVRLERTPTSVLGRLRNVALENASGDVVAQWDDDDWYHAGRLERQVSVLLDGADACCLGWTLVHVNSAEFFDHPYAGRIRHGVPGTLVHLKTGEVRYPELRRAEDNVYLGHWRRKRYVQLPPSEMHLFIRCYHGQNTWEMDHFLRRLRSSPAGLLAYAWYAGIRRDPFAHPAFTLGDQAREAFALYLEDSYRTGVFPAAPCA